jgi:hypothetical protein
MGHIGNFYTITNSMRNVPLRDHLQHGYEFEDAFKRAIRDLMDRWQGRVGECVDEKNGFLLLRFHDTPGGVPDEARLPLYALVECEKPSWLIEEEEEDEITRELDEAFGFD